MAKTETDTALKSQLDKFKNAARELGCDDDEQRFQERLGKLVRTPTVDNGRVGDKKDSPTEA